MKNIKGEFLLLLAAILWGTCFVFQKMGMDYIGPFTLGAFRFLIGSVALTPIIFVSTKLDFQKSTKLTESHGGFLDKQLYVGGILCGCALFAAASLQQVGLMYTTAGKAAFITSLEIVLVAIVVLIASRKIQLNIIIGVIIAITGMYLLCMVNGFYLEIGDTYELIGVIFWAFQILLIDHYAKKVNVIKLSFVQFVTTGILSGICMIIFENPQIVDIRNGAVSILYTAIIEVAIAYTLQMIGQKYTSPVIAAIILSLESVVAVVCGVVILGEIMSLRQELGCFLMFLAVLVSQFDCNRLYTKNHKKFS